jgi:site-specific recombinase XerD
MFETALDLGLRRGEMLKLKISSLPRGSETGVRVIRFPDDPEDTRTVEPAVKTAERVIPASRDLLRSINLYLTTPRPLGRSFGKSPYLFVTRTGAPLSIDRAADIIEDIAAYSGVKFSWHSLRHTWAESLAETLCNEPNGLDHLQWLGGWTNPESPKRYIQNAIAKQDL